MNMLMLGGWAAAATRATVATRRNADELISIKAGRLTVGMITAG